MKRWNGIRQLSLGPGACIFAFVFLLRLWALARLTSSPWLLPAQGDMHFYNDWALKILHGRWTDHHAFYGLPLYPYLLAALYKLFGYNPFLAGFIQAGFEGGTALLIYKLASQVFGRSQNDSADNRQPPHPADLESYRGKIIGLVAAVGWGFFQPAQAYSIILMPTAPLVFVFWLVVWLIVKHKVSPGRPFLFFIGLLIGFTAMGIATVLFLLPLLLAAIVFKWKVTDNRHSGLVYLTSIALLFGGVLAGTSPCWLHNYFAANDPVFLSAHGGVNFWIGNNPQANGYPKFPPGLRPSQEGMLADSISQVETAAGHPLNRSEVSRYWSDKAWTYIRTNPLAWLRLVGVKIRNFWSAFQYDDISAITSLRDDNVILPGLSFGIVAALGIPGMIYGCYAFRRSRWVAAAILLHLCSLLTVFVTERYRLAAVPGLLLFGAFILWEFGQAALRANYGRVLAYAALLIASTLFVSLPERDSSLWALDSYNSGLQALESKDLDLAQKRLSRAYAYVPGNAEVNFALGNLRLAQGKVEEAQRYYLSTVRLNPQHEGAYNNLGVLALAEKHDELAEQFLSKAFAQDPGDANTCYLLAQAHLQAGHVKTAGAAISEALRLKPAQPEFVALQDKINSLGQP